jgi:hypothetical protein
MPPLASVSDDQLLSHLHTLVRRGNAFEAELLTHLGELDSRRLYAREGCSSMFNYCVEVLHFAEASAYKRIQAARAARRYPELLEAVRRGDLHVTGVSLIAPKLKSEKDRDLIAAARGQTADAIRRLLADREPKPDVPASVRKVDSPDREEVPPGERREQNPPTPAVRVPPRVAESGSSPIEPRRRLATSQPLGGERYCVRFTADGELHAQIQELRALMRHQIPDGDLGRLHHAEPWVDSRAHAVENVTLRCRAHNQYAAVRDFGERHMARFRGNWI